MIIIGLQDARRLFHVEIGAAVARSTAAVDERECVADAHHFVVPAIDVREPIWSSTPDRPTADGHLGVSAAVAGQYDVRYHLRRATERGRHDNHHGTIHRGHVIDHRVLATHAATVDVELFAITRQ